MIYLILIVAIALFVIYCLAGKDGMMDIIGRLLKLAAAILVIVAVGVLIIRFGMRNPEAAGLFGMLLLLVAGATGDARNGSAAVSVICCLLGIGLFVVSVFVVLYD